MSLVFACLGIMAVAAFAVLLVLTLTSPASPLCVRRRGAGEVAAVPASKPRVPRDTSRPYPRTKGSRSKLNRVCPVCGTGPETGDLDRRLLGWPAHRTCAEWLGDWGPPGYVPPPPYRPTGSITAVAVSNSPGVQVNVGDRNKFPRPAGQGASRQVEISARLANGTMSRDEARAQLDLQIVASWGVPPMMLEEHTHMAGDPVPSERCPKCGAQFLGTPDYLRTAFKMHRQLGCRT